MLKNSKLPKNEKMAALSPIFVTGPSSYAKYDLHVAMDIHILDADWVEGTDTPVTRMVARPD